jgi:putative MATE family efflux protein
VHDLTTGPISGHLLRTTSFMLVGMILQTLYVLVDLYWVSHLGTAAVAAVGLCGNLGFVVLAVTQMLGVGTTALVAHASGGKDRDRALLVFNQSQVLSVVVGLLFFAVGLLLRWPYAHSLSADVETTRLAAEYLGWFIPAMALQFGMVAMGAALRGTGQFRPGMIVQAATVAVNMVLAPVLIFGWGTGHPLGITGAALATFIAIVAGTIWLAVFFRPAGAFLKLMPADWRPRPGLWGEVLRIGLPAGVEFALLAVYLMVVYTVCRPFGAAAQAGFGIGMRVVQACFLPVVALGFAVAPVAGQNFGARQAERVRATFRSAAAMATAMMAAVVVGMHIAPGAIVRFFSSDVAVVAVGEEFLRIVSWNFVSAGNVLITSSMFQAMGNTLPSLATWFIRIVVVAGPALLLARVPGFELRWVWYLTVVSATAQLAVNLLLLRREFRVRLAFAPTPAP